ncbi:hypothetical protein [Synechocystis sp. CS-94]|uniref:hypothetical protein n=1 Tax=Synechocystis sp. CS-94 TaxID=2847986 RepID=UPI00223ABD30|nr:hypothetical protein [Synechocystis sp. CS-94]MCT0254797.1 hypothetical protein [Synechocystis sp. CS-94]
MFIDHKAAGAITPPDALWANLSNIEKVVINTTKDGAQTITTGKNFEAAFAPLGVELTTTTAGAGAITLNATSFTGEATFNTTSLAGAQTITTGSGGTTVNAKSDAGGLNIKGIGLNTVFATTTGAGAQIIGDNSGNGANLTFVDATSAGGSQIVTSTSTEDVIVNATSNAGKQIITTGSGNDIITASTASTGNFINAGAGNDVITILPTASGDYTVDGGLGDDNITGGAGNDLLIGDLGNDTLDGGDGINTLVGGVGNDTYVVDSTTDIITEAPAEGTDTVQSSVTFDLTGVANVENLTLTGTGNINGTGNAFDNVIMGNDGNNSLNGGNGNDTIIGGGGNDIIDGGGQTDTLKYSGDRSNYTITLSGGTYTIVDERGGSPDGTDTVTTVENFQFADGTFTTANLIDTTAPTVVNIDDGDADNVVTVGEMLTYTITFSEDINASTVSTFDFNNAGTAAIGIGTITETSAGIFTVEVIPTSTGTINLRIPTGAVIEDVAGNALTVPVQDGDIITVNANPNPDMIAPTVVNINDGDADNVVTVGEILTYTITFSEDINASTVSTFDFNNAGTAAIGIGTITETSAGIFTVEVTPTSTGTINLRIPTGAVVEDVAGNALTVPVQDGEIITVNANPNPDTIAPTVVNIDDGEADNVVTVGEMLTYTITFSEDINASTVSTFDFNNAGTATIGIGTITETSAGIFTVEVTPTSTGTINLRIPTGGVVEDVAGNALTVPVQDGDTITVNAIPDPMAPSISLAVSPDNVTEDGNTNLVYTFTRTGDLTSPLIVNYNICGTANEFDYTGATPGNGKTITFATGSNTTFLTINPTADTTVEPDNTVVLTLDNGMGYTIDTTASVISTIINDDSPNVPDNNVSISTRNDLFFVQLANGNEINLSYNNQPFVSGTFGNWQAVEAETVNSINQVLWQNFDTGEIGLWNTDSNWNWVSSEVWPTESPKTLQAEVTFQTDINNDDLLGDSYSIVENQGCTVFLQGIFDYYHVQTVDDITQPIKYLGEAFVPGTFGNWQGLAAETVDGINQVLWQNVGTGEAAVWNTDSNWNWVSSDVFAIDSPQAQALQPTFGVNFI